jgi:hypothetical protein
MSIALIRKLYCQILNPITGESSGTLIIRTEDGSSCRTLKQIHVSHWWKLNKFDNMETTRNKTYFRSILFPICRVNGSLNPLNQI